MCRLAVSGLAFKAANRAFSPPRQKSFHSPRLKILQPPKRQQAATSRSADASIETNIANHPESLPAKLYLQTLQQRRPASPGFFQLLAIAEIFDPGGLAGHIFYCVNPRSRYCLPNPTTCMMHSPLGTQRKFIPDDEISPMPNTGAQA
jgi:hypothetical protein